jgi:hypothetical protein
VEEPSVISIVTLFFLDFLAHFYTEKFIILFLLKVSIRPLVMFYSQELRQHFGVPLRITVAIIHAGTVDLLI